MLDFLTLKPEAFGLDISDLSLKIAKLKKRGDFFSLASFGEMEIPSGVIKGGEIKNEDKLVKIIRESLKKIKGKKLRTKYVVASLPEEKAFLQVIPMPKMKKEELKEAVRFEAENYIPLPLEQVYFDSQIVPSPYNHLDHLDVLIAALPKKTVDPYVSVLKKSGLQPVVLEIESQAITRALIKRDTTSKPLLIIDFGATRTSFIIFSGYSLSFTFSIPVSSQKLTEAISKTLKISENKAEKLKIEYGIEKKEGLKSKKVFDAMIPSLTDLVEQIKRCLNYYYTHGVPKRSSYNSNRSEKVEKILLCGGGANLKGLREFLIMELKLPVQLGNPWINILPEPLKEIPELSYKESLKYTTALGLALRGVKREDD